MLTGRRYQKTSSPLAEGCGPVRRFILPDPLFVSHTYAPGIEKLPARKSVAHNTTITQEFEIVVIKVILQFLTKWLPNGALGRKRFVKITP